MVDEVAALRAEITCLNIGGKFVNGICEVGRKAKSNPGGALIIGLMILVAFGAFTFAFFPALFDATGLTGKVPHTVTFLVSGKGTSLQLFSDYCTNVKASVQTDAATTQFGTEKLGGLATSQFKNLYWQIHLIDSAGVESSVGAGNKHFSCDAGWDGGGVNFYNTYQFYLSRSEAGTLIVKTAENAFSWTQAPVLTQIQVTG